MDVPGPLRNYVLDFEARIEGAVADLAASIDPGARVLDAGAGEGAYRSYFAKHRYCGIDLGIGDAGWDYSGLDAVGDLASLPFAGDTFAAALNIVTLEHVRDPRQVVCELARVLEPGGMLLLAAPQEWEIHQHPHDFYRFTRYGIQLLAQQAGLEVERLEAAGGYFRLLSRRLLLGYRMWPRPLGVLWLLAVAPAALLLPMLDGLDRKQDFTLGYVARLRKPGL